MENHQSHLGKDWIGITNTQGRVFWDSFLGIRPSEMPKLIAIGHTEHRPGLPGLAFHEEGPCMLIQTCFSSDPAWAQQPISLMRMRVNLGKPGTLKTFWRIFFFLTRWYNSFSKEKKIWVKSYTWFCWQSLMSKAEQNGQKPLPTGTDCGALFIPEHPRPSQLGLWFSPVLSLEQFIPKWEYCNHQSCAPYNELLFLEKDLEEGLSLLRRALELRNQEDAGSWE